MSFSRLSTVRPLFNTVQQCAKRSVGVLGNGKICSVAPTPKLAPITPHNLTVRTMASKADSDLVQFLSEEIKAEKGNQKPLPTLEGFKVTAEGSELSLTKEFNGESILVQLNVNHTVDSAEPDDGTEEAPEMKSRPNFEVDIKKPNGKSLSFSCSYIYGDNSSETQAKEEGYEDVFAIDEVTMFEGEWSEKNYAVAGDILDGYLYDLFMNMLNERGIDAQFAEKLSDYCSAYEHSQYIQMLENLQDFAKA